MKNPAPALILASVFSLAAVGLGHAKSEFLTLSTTALWPLSSTQDSNVVYSLSTVGRGGAGVLEVTLTAGDLPPGVTVTFSPKVVRFTGNQLKTQTAIMTVHCSVPTPVDCFPFTVTGTSKNETITITNLVLFTPQYVASRRAMLCLDDLGNSALRLRGLGATGKTYQLEATADFSNPVWTPLGNSSADGNGRFTFFTAKATNAPMRFFRAVEFAPAP
jgi:hypothetical protein